MAITTHGTMATERVSKTRFHFAHLMSRNPCEITINGIIKHMKKVRERERITHLHDKLASIGTLKREKFNIIIITLLVCDSKSGSG